MSGALSLRQWVKARRHPVARVLHAGFHTLRASRLPVVPGLHAALYRARQGGLGLWHSLRRMLWDTPLFLSQTSNPPSRLFLYGGIPLILGPLRLRIGEDCRISGQVTLTARPTSKEPTLIVGRNCDIGWQTTIAVGTRVVLGDNVRIAGRAFLAGYPGHPLEAEARALGLPDDDSQCGDIILEPDVWLATGVTVNAGIRIGRGTVVAAGSVVTKDLPPNVLAGGVPARVIRSLADKEPDHGP
ncbi:MAG: acyltransferase [Beijerinckiaceae bacterium]|jgi:acetyltransferase-like isoleucine patch superfamily enzyme|nr:acyltransferase [Beijerinckiaceae bacterium]